MPSIMKNLIELGGDIANTQVANSAVADIFAPLINTGVANSGVGKTDNTALAENLDIQAIIDSGGTSSNIDGGKLVYRTSQSIFKYPIGNGKSSGFLLPSGSKVVKLGEQKDMAIVIVWNNGNYYKGIMPLESLNPTKTQNLISPEGFLSDAKHTLFRFERRVQQLGHSGDPFVGRILPPLRQSIKNFGTLFSNNPKEAENRLKSAFGKYQPLLSRSGNKVDIVNRHLDAIFSVNDFEVNGAQFSEQVRVLPLSTQWLDKYYDGKDEINLKGMFGGESGEGVKNEDPAWQGFVSAIKHLLNVTEEGEGKNTLEGKWLLDNITPALLESTIKEIICIQDATWNFNALNDIAASGILLRDIHGPFFTSALFTVVTHELNVNAFTNLFTPEDTHILSNYSDNVQRKVINEDYLAALTGDVNWEDALYRSHSYLSAISLRYIFKLIFT